MTARRAALVVVLACVACGDNAPHHSLDAGPVDSPLGLPEVGPAPAGPRCGLALTVGEGGYVLQSCDPAWTFGGLFPARATDLQLSSGTDALGEYVEAGFRFTSASAHRGTIRVYAAAPIALFSLAYVDGGPNTEAFPTLSVLPTAPHRLGYAGMFSQYSFTNQPAPESPWIFFDDAAHTFILSEASHFMHAAITQGADGALAVGINPSVATVPAGYVQTAMLVVEPGVNKAFETWGSSLLKLSAKVPVSNHSSSVLSSLGYWTGAWQSYYYTYDQTLGYEGTLAAVAAEFQSHGVPLGYLQLDSWWYPKGGQAVWSDGMGGMYRYAADPTLFPDGLASFQANVHLPLLTHARWVDGASPYRTQYRMSAATIIDPAYWADRMSYLHASGVTMYEQDWLDHNALPLLDNLTDADDFLGSMAAAAQAEGMQVMYCMELPGHILQSTLYPSVVTTRVSVDRFEDTRWTPYIYGSRLASAVGLWPWSDAFSSTERDNLILSVLSAGPVGVGDALHAQSFANLASAARPDAVLVRPDTPIVPLDATFVDDANGTGRPMIAAATTVDGPRLRAAYVFAYQTGTAPTASFAPSALGLSGPVLVYDVFAATAVRQDASVAYTHNVSGGTAFLTVVPVGASGIVVVGDLGKYVSLGRERISSLTDDGIVHVGVAFAATETAVTLTGYAAAKPTVTATSGTADAPSFDAATGRFQVVVHPAAGAATVDIAP